MSKKALASFLIAGTFLSMNASFAAGNFTVQPNVPQYGQYGQYGQQYAQPYNQQPSPQYGQSYKPQTYVPPLKGHVFMVPAGASIPAVTTCELNTSTMTIGQGVSVALGNDFYYNGQMVAPAGSQVNGNIILLRKGGMAGKNAQLKVKFTNIQTPYGQMIPISGTIKTDDGSGILYAATAKDTTKAYAKDIIIGSAAGALMGTIMGPISGGKVGKGAALGTAVGAIGGLGKSVIDKGIDVVIPPNSRIDIAIDQPITVNSCPQY